MHRNLELNQERVRLHQARQVSISMSPHLASSSDSYPLPRTNDFDLEFYAASWSAARCKYRAFEKNCLKVPKVRASPNSLGRLSFHGSTGCIGECCCRAVVSASFRFQASLIIHTCQDNCYPFSSSKLRNSIVGICMTLLTIAYNG